MEYWGTLRIKNPKTLRRWKRNGKFQALIDQGYIYASGCGRFRKEVCACNKCRKKMRKTIYELAVEAGCELSHHESDLYLKKTDESQKLVDNYEFKQNVTTFHSDIDHSVWFDVPFAYDPFWEKGQKYLIFNATDGVYASPEEHTKESGLKMIQEFRDAIEDHQGYYLTHRMERIPVQDVKFTFQPIENQDERF